MEINRKNAEGYNDPTAYQALCNVIKMDEKIIDCERVFRPLVYICSPYSGDVLDNIMKAQKYSRFAAKRGVIPIAPHLLFTQFLDDEQPNERSLGLFFGKVVMDFCKQLWVFGEEISPGMMQEITRAKYKGYRVRYFDSSCNEIFTKEVAIQSQSLEGNDGKSNQNSDMQQQN